MGGVSRDERVAVVVLGDLGRSPRMQYHVLSLVEQAKKKEVHVVAYGVTQPHASLSHSRDIHLHYLPELQLPGGVPRPLAMVAKALFQLFVLFYTLLVAVPSTGHLLLQTPPSIPTFLVCKLVCLLKRTVFVIDWHNFGYTLMALNLSGPDHPLVKVAERYERFFGKFGDAHFCVTKAMKKELEKNWGVARANVLYDRPPQFFQPLSYGELHSLFVKLRDDFSQPMHHKDCCLLPDWFMTTRSTRTTTTTTLFTEKAGQGTVQHVADRPVLVVSSTSWTPDEDFGILLQAAKLYDDMTHDLKSYPRLLFVITGKGPMREMYRKKMSQMEFKKVAFRLMWLSAEDYPM
jgi:beta-1,4-mannosyltransferase